ncbi:hypothetical protein TNIN_225791 [Trichonephila inaurata madagascariensis]|uniref:Uncharacterized protein n=1 Tax=Trichonephila inaurata madagascariensis TaxID=2747483 RepID=A0A8X6YCN9_9ARAC|nr:hypothetical protein TNIN_225791 [Trichonephila inaurata madagascariensis]
MNPLAFSIPLLILLGTGFNFADAASEDTLTKMRALLCDDEMEEARELIMECVNKVDWTEYESIIKPCNEAFENFDVEEMRQKMCQASDEEINQIDECISTSIDESGKKEEMAEKAEPVGECMRELFSEE